ncbi:MAG: alpha/beta fold hydrolase [bacterium]|nr:alpha/beta fold hydrolase [bacterium]
MQVELVHTSTSDGLTLSGTLRRPQTSGSDLPIDACIFVHGRGGNFYASGLLEDCAVALLQAGCAVYRINTRGAAGEVGRAQTPTGRKYIGAACEIVDECRYDLDAWIAHATDCGFTCIALWGHSLGALKSIYYQAQTQDARLTRLVASSPPWLSYEHFLIQPEGEKLADMYKNAKARVDAGQGDKILTVTAPLAGTLSTASQYVEKYGPADRYNILSHLPNVSCPTLITVGTEEAKTMMAFRGLYEALKALANQQSNLSVASIEGADHSYTGVREQAQEIIFNWLRTQ